jgi:hypothetical protein
LANLLPGSYHLEIVDANDCVFPFDFEIGYLVGTIESSHESAITVAPNPFSDQVTVRWSGGESLPRALSVFTLSGIPVPGLQLEVPAGQRQIILDRAQFPATGAYLVVMRSSMEHAITVLELVE